MDMIDNRDPYCVNELDERQNHIYILYLGLKDKTRPGDALRMDIESVRIPKERVEMYKRGRAAGPDDIALIKTRDHVAFTNRINPVS